MLFPFFLVPVHEIRGIVRGRNTHTLHLAAISLEENHAEARKEAEDKEGNSLQVAAGVARAEVSSSTLGAGSRAALAGATVGTGTSAGGSGLGGDDASAGGASLAQFMERTAKMLD